MEQERVDSPATRRTSLALLIGTLVDHDSLSRSDLERLTQLSRVTVNQVLASLTKCGIVEIAGYGKSNGGRRPELVRLAGTAAYTLGAAMYDREWIMTLTDLWGRPIAEERQPMNGITPTAAIDALEAAYERMKPAMTGRRVPPLLGVGAPGLIDMNRGFIHSSVNLGWKDVAFADLITERIGLAAFVANRSKCSALAEAWLAPDGTVDNLIYIHLGLGVPAGIVLNGQLVTGNHSFAGELGHFTVVPDGSPCPCGNRGCLQMHVSEDAIRHRATTMAYRDSPDHEELTAEWVLRAADDGDPVCRHVVCEAAGYLAVAVANLVNLLDPDRIVLGGPMAEWSQLLIDETRRQVAYRAMHLPLSVSRIERSSLGIDSGALGSALMVRPKALEMIAS